MNEFYFYIQRYLIYSIEESRPEFKADAKKELDNFTNMNVILAVSLLSYFIFLNRVGRRLCSYADIKFNLRLPQHQISKCIQLLKKNKLISVSRKGNVNGTLNVNVNNERVEELAQRGKEIFNEIKPCFVDYRKEETAKAIKKIESNCCKKKSMRISEAANLIAYEEITQNDIHNTGYSFKYRQIIQIISKAHFKFFKKKLVWNDLMAWRVFKLLAEVPHSDANQEAYLGFYAKPQRLADIVEFMSQVDFMKEAQCSSTKFELMFENAIKELYKFQMKKYGKTYDHYYNEFGHDYLEDKNYYLNKVDTSNSNVLDFNKLIKKEEQVTPISEETLAFFGIN